MTQLGLLSDTGPMQTGAVFSTDERYRFRLWRTWGPGKPVNFVMLNPSTADASIDDPTIRRCIGFARGWGHDGIIVTNLFAFRATDPRELLSAEEPTVGKENDQAIVEAARDSAIIVAAWGAHPRAKDRARTVLLWLLDCERDVFCIARTLSGSPVHPLYQPREREPQPYRRSAIGEAPR